MSFGCRDSEYDRRRQAGLTRSASSRPIGDQDEERLVTPAGHPCAECFGSGKQPRRVGDDFGHREPCPRCKGSGIEPTNPDGEQERVCPECHEHADGWCDCGRGPGGIQPGGAEWEVEVEPEPEHPASDAPVQEKDREHFPWCEAAKGIDSPLESPCTCKHPAAQEKRAEDVEGEHCQECGRSYDYVWWCFDRQLWGEVTGHEHEPGIADAPGLLCIDCFDRLARDRCVWIEWAPVSLRHLTSSAPENAGTNGEPSPPREQPAPDAPERRPAACNADGERQGRDSASPTLSSEGSDRWTLTRHEDGSVFVDGPDFLPDVPNALGNRIGRVEVVPASAYDSLSTRFADAEARIEVSEDKSAMWRTRAEQAERERDNERRQSERLLEAGHKVESQLAEERATKEREQRRGDSHEQEIIRLEDKLDEERTYLKVERQARDTWRKRYAEERARLTDVKQFADEYADPVRVARRFHEVYERRAPDFSYKTREASAVPWPDVPQANRELMVAVVTEVLDPLLRSLRPASDLPGEGE